MKAPCKFLMPGPAGARVVREGEDMDAEAEAYAKAAGLVSDAPAQEPPAQEPPALDAGAAALTASDDAAPARRRRF